MTSMIERVARAIASGWEEGSFEKDPQRWREDARAVIKAMREPSREIKSAIFDALPEPLHIETSAVGIWEKAIDAALAEESDV